MRQGEDHIVMVTRQEPCPVQGQPALGLERRALGTGAMPARVVPDTGDVAVGARLDMPAQGGGPALHEGVRGAAHVGRQGMALLIGGKGVLEDRLERDERHRASTRMASEHHRDVVYSITPTIPAASGESN